MSWDNRERRKFVRVNLPLEVCIPDLTQVLKTKTENISAGGIRLIINKKLTTGLIINLKIHNINKNPIDCQGKVLWVFNRTISADNNHCHYDTGIEFYKIKKEDIKAIEKIIACQLSKK
jgi:c-di-GMP-binding flagellar brake protein YcgR